MTFSILARDPESGAIGGAAATGSYCVGGWVLRGALDAGMSASQGAAPSTFWGEDVLSAMRDGMGAADAVGAVTGTDAGRDWRQLSAMNLAGEGAVFTGVANTGETAERVFENGVAAGNLLASAGVVEAMVEEVLSAKGAFDHRLLSALRAAEAAGSDSRGLFSAALLVLHPERPPLSLRVDYDADDPVGALAVLREKTSTGGYADWLREVPTWTDRGRTGAR
ncbi:Uncharacterized conserved protein, Ntn-hydrolase superfamily [Rhodovulum sp. ES.010]|uniref:DUF1028 domain-containing protein n=1 Tax=Rhodovulum sp. ES.010 TaxID=1882821 RepID=UPI000926DB66|nr:DUF1028 domain-containing protein [Rhodovulum sp. ES.010]SIO47628.1 Uncharacterized conserved protein, Ntn-hydrolase superfamily [Rhodovulum sp. ES.010]